MERLDRYVPGEPLPRWHGAIATIGVFDGVHLGHRAILDRALTWARTERRPALVLTFSTHPDLVVHGSAPERLQSLDQRLRELERAGFDAALVLPFDRALRELSAEAFVERILAGSLALRGLVLGHDTAIGRNRRGDAALLDALGARFGFAVQSVGRIAIDGEVVSSTRIRDALKRGDLDAASRLLGRTPSLLGRVVHGDGRGRTLGCPTANLDTGGACLPADGVYAVIVIDGEARRRGVCNVGVRPTLTTGEQRTVEVHLLDFAGDLYGRELELLLWRRLRGERRFDGVDALRAQIDADRAAAEEALRRWSD